MPHTSSLIPVKIVSVAQMRELEQGTDAAGVSLDALMERAGLAVAREARALLGGAAGRQVVALIGPGNNGGDGLVAVRHLRDWGAVVEAFLPAERRSPDPKLDALQGRDVPVFRHDQPGFQDAFAAALGRAEMLIDAVLGTGRSRPLGGAVAQTLETAWAVRQQRPALRVLAVDIPTGLDSDTGAFDPAGLRADVTVALGYPKAGMFEYPGADAVGVLRVVDIGLKPGLAADLPLALITAESVRPLLPQRPSNANKGTFGRTLVVAGSGSFVGASMLACRGALRSGAGLVTLATAAPLVHVVAGTLVEPTYIPLPATPAGAIAAHAAAELAPRLGEYAALAAGCGLGQAEETRAFLEALLLTGEPLPSLVLDADALNILAGIPRWWERLRASAVLTPHPGEMARLLGSSVPDIQRSRVATALAAAQSWGQTVVLKGAYSVVAAPDGSAWISPFANPALATAGTGDVLTGIIAGLLAQRMGPLDAAISGVYLHGAAGARFAGTQGDAGLLASDLPALLPEVIHGIKEAAL